MIKPCISIILCTCNRAEELYQTLRSLADLWVPEEMPTELVVVDNASTDETAKVVGSCPLPNMAVKYVFEPRCGKGYAYNTGMAEAQGQVFLFTDDDVRPPRNWITGMCQPILAGEADAAAGGVRFAPHLQRDWMQPKHRSVLASTERLDADQPEDMVGANMAFSRHVLDRVPQFDTALGPGALGFVDDTLFSLQLKEAGYRIKPALDIVVEHHFQESRLRHASFLQTAEKLGNSLAYLAYHWHHSEPNFLYFRWVKRRLSLNYWKLKHRRMPQDKEGISLEELDLMTMQHFYDYLYHESHKSRRYQKYGLIKNTTKDTKRDSLKP